MMEERRNYPLMEEEDDYNMSVQEPAMSAAYAYESVAIPNDMAYAHIQDGVLQVTPDLEEEIAEVERGEFVSMDEFKTMFSQWLD